MLKRIISFEHNNNIKVSEPIEEKKILARDLRNLKRFEIINDKDYKKENVEITKRQKLKQEWDCENKQVINHIVDLPFEEWPIEEQIQYLYKELLNLKGENTSEIDE